MSKSIGMLFQTLSIREKWLELTMEMQLAFGNSHGSELCHVIFDRLFLALVSLILGEARATGS